MGRKATVETRVIDGRTFKVTHLRSQEPPVLSRSDPESLQNPVTPKRRTNRFLEGRAISGQVGAKVLVPQDSIIIEAA